MDEQNVLNQENDQDDAVAIGEGDADEQGSAQEASQGNAGNDDPYGVKKRLGMQAKKHQREMRAMQEQLMQMRSQFGQQQSQQQDHYSSPGQPDAIAGNEEDRIQKAVRYALQAKEAEEQRAKDAERQQHVQKQYQRLHGEFDKASDKYEDFDDVVRGDDVPFTSAVRDALLLVENPADVAYRLGKNRDELERISRLHPLDQAREVNKLSFALMNGSKGKSGEIQKSNPMGNIKPNPAGAAGNNMSAASIRDRMKSGTWK